MAETDHTHRPELHITSETGVLNAPAGVLLDGATWHVFHQYRPEADSGPRWGHQFAEGAPFVWEVADDVLAPTGGETQNRAGSVVSNGSGVDLYFTSVTSAGASIHLARIQDLPATLETVSEDPFVLDSHVVRIGRVVGDTEDWKNFRSPCVIPGWEDGSNREEGHEGWLMLAVTGPAESPTVVVLNSPDGMDWQVQGPLTFAGYSGLDGGEVLVSPRVIRLRDEVDHEIYDIVIVTIEKDGIDISGYLVGRLTGSEFSVSTPFTRVDFGHDFSRPRNTNFTPGTVREESRYDEAFIFGLMNGIGRLDDPQTHLSLATEGWANAITVPRVATLQGGTLFQTPPKGLLDAIHDSEAAAGWTGLCEIPQGSSVSVALIDAGGDTAAVVSHRHNELVIDRSMNPHHPDSPWAVAPLTAEDTDSMFILVDGSTVEVFADGGYVAMASRVYFDGGPISAFDVSITGDACVRRSSAVFPETFSSSGLPDLDDLTEFNDDEEPDEGLVR
ncbi:GH32 C-terminal domain-containing protein [Corynebacterium pacaense]|uniref:GH32 C-terminal domain-containing protein n=1 Tax=Corynebacterium pacaense TaxID=1816684 RepID=UPI0009BC685E|nr:GH32 C-terminal domain-containing protein [Corynebacterium pacaense]